MSTGIFFFKEMTSSSSTEESKWELSRNDHASVHDLEDDDDVPMNHATRWIDAPETVLNSNDQTSSLTAPIADNASSFSALHNHRMAVFPQNQPQMLTNVAPVATIPGWPSTGTSTVILNINGIRQEIPISLNLEKALDPNSMAELGLAFNSVPSNTFSVQQIEAKDDSSTPADGDNLENSLSGSKNLLPTDNMAASSALLRLGKKGKIDQCREPIDMVVRSSDFERKSVRLEQKRRQQIAVKFEPESNYSVDYPWCDECQQTYESSCTEHPLYPIPDRPVFSFAKASLPTCLSLATENSDNKSVVKVLAKKHLQKRTTFGPLEGMLVDDSPPKTHAKLPVEINKKKMYYSLGDESVCNWMMFVDMATTAAEQNLVVYQNNQHLYFTCIKDISPKEELKFGYAPHYAHHFKLSQNGLTGADYVKSEKWRFECTECEETFRTAAQLQAHSAKHDDDGSDVALNLVKTPPSSPLPAQNHLVIKKKPLATRLKLQKYHQLRNRALQKCQKDQWSCSFCPLTFNKESVFKLHNYIHKPNRKKGDEGDIEHDCPQCHVIFPNFRKLTEHASTHGTTKAKPFMCSKCNKHFKSQDRLELHLRVHTLAEADRPYACTICSKRCLTSSALACHTKTHSDKSFFTCLVCQLNGQEGHFEHKAALRKHSEVHRQGTGYPCPACHHILQEFSQLRIHIRSHHPTGRLPCTICHKVFTRIDKLKLHMVVHSDVKQYMCDQCGRQFKRKDKLAEHTKRVHNPSARVRRLTERKVWRPRVPNTDFERFIYRCVDCQLGFKRRGMLVNHMTKCHPEKPISAIPELNLPILRTQKDFFCQHCDKVYRSSSKRKAHILSKHPGAELPPSLRPMRGAMDKPDEEATFSATVGSTTARAQACHLCPKQYASRPKLLQHLRAQHPEAAPPPKHRNKHTDTSVAELPSTGQDFVLQSVDQQPGRLGDLLAQAMSELTQNIGSGNQMALLHDNRLQPMIISGADFDSNSVSLSQVVLIGNQTQTGSNIEQIMTNPLSLVTVGRRSSTEQQYLPF